MEEKTREEKVREMYEKEMNELKVRCMNLILENEKLKKDKEGYIELCTWYEKRLNG
jgi:hypothetical protein